VTVTGDKVINCILPSGPTGNHTPATINWYKIQQQKTFTSVAKLSRAYVLPLFICCMSSMYQCDGAGSSCL